MTKRGLLVIISAALLIAVSQFMPGLIINFANDMKITAVSDYIEVASTGEKIHIKKIETIDTVIWKGAYDGILHLLRCLGIVLLIQSSSGGIICFVPITKSIRYQATKIMRGTYEDRCIVRYTWKLYGLRGSFESFRNLQGR